MEAAAALAVSSPQAIEPVMSVDMINQRRAELDGKKLADFNIEEKVGGSDPTAAQQAGYQNVQSGCNSYVYRVRPTAGYDGPPLAMKVMLNMGHAQSVNFKAQFEAEFNVLLSDEQLPSHQNIISVFSHFTDDVDAGPAPLPGWDFDDSVVMKRTSFVLMPFFPRDLKKSILSNREKGLPWSSQRARRICCDMLKAVGHLQAHHIAHRDLKPDNILLQNHGTPHEMAVLTDFGMCKDFSTAQGPWPPEEMKLVYADDNQPKGGAQDALAPEIQKQKHGWNQATNTPECLDYSKNDQWCVGLVIHELMAGVPDHAWPSFAGASAAGAKDEDYVDVDPQLYGPAGCPGYAAPLNEVVRELLRVDPADRMTTADALARLDELAPAPAVEEPAADQPAAVPEPEPFEEQPYPGPLQDDWMPRYESVKMSCLFGDALDFVEEHPECANNRAYGATGWTLLHQAAYWRIGEGLLTRLRDVGAHPHLVAQTYAQVQSGAPGRTPLQVTADNDSPASRHAFRTAFCEVFGLEPPAAGAVPAEPEPQPAEALGMPPAADPPQPVAAMGEVPDGGGEFKLLMCGDLALTANTKHQGATLHVRSPLAPPSDGRTEPRF